MLKKKFRADKRHFRNTELADIAWALLDEIGALPWLEHFNMTLYLEMVESCDFCEYCGRQQDYQVFDKRSEIVEFIYNLAVEFCPEED